MILLYFLFLLNFSYAVEISYPEVENSLQTIQSINKSGLIQTPRLDCSYSLSNTAKEMQSSSELFNKCAVDLCGLPSQNVSAWTTDINFAKSLSPSIFKKVEKENPRFNKIFDIAKKASLKELKMIKDYLAGSTNPYEKLSSDDKEQLGKAMFIKHFELNLTDSKDVAKRIELTINPPKNSTDEFIKALSEYGKKVQASFIFEAGNDDHFSVEELKSAFNSKIAELKTARLTSKELQLLNQYQTNLNQALNSIDAEVILKKIKDFDNSQQKKGKPSVFPRASCDTELCKKVATDFFTSNQTKTNLALYESALNNPQALTNAINSCKAKLIMNEERASDEKKMNAIFKEAKDIVKQKVLPHFSEHSRQIMITYLDQKLEASNRNIKLIGKFGALSYFNHQADQYIAFQKNSGNTLPQLFIWEKIIDIQKSIDTFYPFNNVSPCFDLNSSGHDAWDAFANMKNYKKEIYDDSAKKEISKMSDNPHVFISDFSCNHSGPGRFNVTHEIGHALNHLIINQKLSTSSLAKYKDLRLCVQKNQPLAKVHGASLFPEDKNYPNEGYYTEEDMADLFAAMSTNDDPKIQSCSFLRPSKLRDVYTDLTFSNEDSLDNHSPEFVRLLFEVINKKRDLPNSCKNLLATERQYISFNKCAL